MAEHRDSEHTLDTLFEWLEKTAPDGYRIDIVEGDIFMTPQRSIHWDITLDIVEQMRKKFPGNESSLMSGSTIPGTSTASAPTSPSCPRRRSSTARGASSTTTSSS